MLLLYQCAPNLARVALGPRLEKLCVFLIHAADYSTTS